MKKTKETLPSYSSVEDMLTEMEERKKQEKKNNPIGYFLRYNVYYPSRRLLSRLSEIPYEIKYFYQRGKRGWADCDVWNFYVYNARVCKEAISKLKKIKHGIPHEVWNEGKKEKQAVKEWNNILDKMIKTFTFLSDENTEQWIEGKDGKHLFKELKDKKPNLYKDSYLMTKEDDKAQKEGFELFQKHYLSLWD
jgi:hypothetical protein